MLAAISAPVERSMAVADDDVITKRLETHVARRTVSRSNGLYIGSHTVLGTTSYPKTGTFKGSRSLPPVALGAKLISLIRMQHEVLAKHIRPIRRNNAKDDALS